jgi:Zn-dependent alcohol dehydrogenase
VADGRIDVKAIVSHTFALDDIDRAFEVAGSGEGLKTLVLHE